MLAIALALGASLSWGLGDFLGGLTSRTLHVLTVLALSQVAGLAAALTWLGLAWEGFPGWSATALAAAAGACGCLGIAALYRGMAVGAMGIVAPVSAVAAVIPFTVGIASGERPSALQVAGILLALAGVGVASREPAELGGGRTAGIGLALVAAVRLRALLRLRRSGRRRERAVRGRNGSRRVARARTRRRPRRRRLPASRSRVTCRCSRRSACSTSARTCCSRSPRRGAILSVVAVLAALYPVVTVALAAIVLHERISAVQRLGVAGALAGAALITAG